MRWLAGAAFVGTLAQAPLGAITVYYHLNPWLVLSHFLLSIVVLALGVIVALEAFGVRGEPVPLARRASSRCSSARRLRGADRHRVRSRPPPARTRAAIDVRRIGKLEPAVWLHVRAVAVFGVAFRAARHLARAAGAAATSAPRSSCSGCSRVQMVVGEVQYRTQLPWGLVLVHVTLAAIVWAATVVFVARLWRPQ